MEIRQLSLFAGLTDEEVERSLTCSRSKFCEYQKKEFIFRQDTVPQWLYFVLEGTVELNQVNALGRQNYVEYIKEGQEFGEIDLFLEHETYGFSAAARSDTRLLAVSRHFFSSSCARECAHHSKIVYNMMRIFAGEADKNTQKIRLLTCGTLRQRIACYLMELSKDAGMVKLPMKREDLASYLNTARPSLSRELSMMQDIGMIRLTDRSHIQILDYELLQAQTEGL